MNVQAFIDSLWIMLKGMAGIFIVTVVIALAMYLLVKLFPEKKQIIIVNAIRARRAAEAVAKTYRISGCPGNLSGRPLIFMRLERIGRSAGFAGGAGTVFSGTLVFSALRRCFFGTLGISRRPGMFFPGPPGLRRRIQSARIKLTHLKIRRPSVKSRPERKIYCSRSQHSKSESILWAIRRALKLLAPHMEPLLSPARLNSSGRTNLMHFTSTSRQVG